MNIGVIGVHSNTRDSQYYKESIEKLRFYGYEVEEEYETSDTPSYIYKYIVDKRSPNWRGWRDILSCIDWRHYPKEIEWNNLHKSIDKVCHLGVSSGGTKDDEECSS